MKQILRALIVSVLVVFQIVGPAMAANAPQNVGQVFRAYNTATHIQFNDVSGGTGLSGLYWAWSDGTAPTGAGTATGTVAEINAGSGVYDVTIPVGCTASQYCTVVFKGTGVSQQIATIETRLSLGNVVVAAGVTNQTAVSIAGNGTGAGLFSQGGATGDGIQVTSNGLAYSNQQYALVARSTGGGAVRIDSTSTTGLRVTGAGPAATFTGTTNGVEMTAGSAGIGLKVTGGSTSGNGIDVTTTSGQGVHLAGSGSGAGLSLLGGATGPGLKSIGQSSGSGVLITPGATGAGVTITGGATSGDAVAVTAANGIGVNLAATGGNAVVFRANSNNAAALKLEQAGASSTVGALNIAGVGEGISITAGTNKDAVKLTPNGSGSGITSSGGAWGFNGVIRYLTGVR